MNDDEAPELQPSDRNALTLVKDVLLVVFIHGFKGTDESFVNFPERLQHVLSETIQHASVECIVFPAYEVCQRCYLWYL